MDVAGGGDRLQDVEVSRGEAGQSEQRQPRRQIDDRGIGAQPRAGGLESLGRAGDPDPETEAAPELGLPARHRR